MSADAYLQARANYDAVKRELEAVTAFLRHTASALDRQPERMIFSNIPAGLPAEASMSRDSIAINADEFPTPVQMQELLARYHRVRDELRSAWFAIPESLHSALKPPPEGVLPTRRRGSY